MGDYDYCKLVDVLVLVIVFYIFVLVIYDCDN